jgi:SAM-dependent methyltransferase
VSWLHFERMAGEYASARPPYPDAVFDALRAEHVIGPGIRVLEVGAGAGLATRALVSSGSEVVAIEPGRELAALLRREVPGAAVVVGRLEDAALPVRAFDSVVAATSLHWVDLAVGLPRLHATLRPSGRLAVLRNVFGDGSVPTDFRERVDEIVARRGTAPRGTGSDERPTMAELASGGWFEPCRTERWRWSVDLTTDQVTRLFRTFSDWTEQEVDAVGRAADACGGRLTEHYRSVLHLLRRSSRATGADAT